MTERKYSSTPVRTNGLVVQKKSVGLKTKQGDTRQERSTTRSAIPSVRARSKSRTRARNKVSTAQQQSPTKQSARCQIDEERTEKPTKVRAPNLTTVTVSRQKQVEPTLVKEYNLEEKIKQSKAEALAKIKAENATRNMLPEGTRKNVGFSDTNEIRSYNNDDGNSKVKEKMSLAETADRMILKLGQFVGEGAVKVIDGVREAAECTDDEIIFDSVDNLTQLQLDVKTKLLSCKDGMFECKDEVNFNETDIQKLTVDCKAPSVIDRFNCAQGNDLSTDEYANDILSSFEDFKVPSINDDKGYNHDGNGKVSSNYNKGVHKFDYVRSDITDDIAFRSMEGTSFRANHTLSEI